MTFVCRTLVLLLLIASAIQAPESPVPRDARASTAQNVAPDSSLAAQKAAAVVPIPQDVEILEGSLALHSLRSIVIGQTVEEDDVFAAELLQEELAHMQIEVSIDYQGPETDEEGSILIRSADVGHESGYRLTISPDGARIEGSSIRGRFYGAMSMLQLLRAAESHVPSVRIVDYPDLALRGIVDDVRTQLSTREDFERIIRFLGEHKMNVYVLPVDGVFRFAIPDSIEAPDGTITSEEFVELQRYAASYHVDLVPAIRARVDPDRSPLPADSTAEALIDELAGISQSRYIYVGGDSYLSGGRTRTDAEDGDGRTDGARSNSYLRLIETARGRGMAVLMDARLPPGAADRMGETARRLPRDLVLLDDQYSAMDSFPSTDLYEQVEQPTVVGLAVRPRGRVFPNHLSAWRNLSVHTLDGFRRGAVGMFASRWTAPTSVHLRASSMRSVAYAAESAWNPDGAEESIDMRFDRIYYHTTTARVRDLVRSLARATEGVLYPSLWNHPIHRALRMDEDSTKAAAPMTGWPDPAAGLSVSGRQGAAADGPDAGRPDAAAGGRQTSARRDAEEIVRMIEAVQPQIDRNADQLDYHAFAARLSAWLAESEDLAKWMADVRAAPPDLQILHGGRGAGWAADLAGRTRSLAQAFRSLWLRTNREIHLNGVLRMFDYQAAYLEEMGAAAADHVWEVQTTASSRFISARSEADTSFLRMTFSLDRGQISEAFLQVAGAGDVRIWLNDREAGRILSNETAIRVWNVAARLRSGNNALALRASGVGDELVGPPAAANVTLEIHFADGRTRRVLSDGSWKARTDPEPRWYDDLHSDDHWPTAVVLGSAPLLTAPMFERGLPSRIE